MSITLISDPDLKRGTGDETVFWQLTGRTPDSGVLEIPIGDAPGGFRDVVPFNGEPLPSEELEIDVNVVEGASGMTFVPRNVPTGQILSGGNSLSRSGFISRGERFCR